MPLSRHIDADDVIERSRDHPYTKHLFNHPLRSLQQPWSRDEDAPLVPKYELPDVGIPPHFAYQLIHDEMALDGNPTLNLASFVQTWMPEYAEKLIMENINKNAVDLDEYPATQVIHNRCVSMIANLWKAEKSKNAIGTATSGSSEAIMLGGLAMKKRWQEARKAAGKDYFHPNIVFGANAQVALEKFARYWDVEARLVPVRAETDFVLNPKDALSYIDENTIGMILILGSTYTGHFENVQEMNDLLDDFQARTGLSIPIHVDAASGGFLAPFAYPGFKWAFDVPRVCSINASGHKFGLVYPGLGWIIWRDESLLPRDLIFELHYLGSTEYSYTLNFSKPASPVLAQMFNFLNLGFEGYRKIAVKGLRNARLLSRALDSTYFTVLSNVHKPLMDNPKALIHNLSEDDPSLYQKGLPVVSFRLSDEIKMKYPHIKQEWIQTLLRGKGWIVPNYGGPPAETKTEMLRIVVRETLSGDLIERLIADILEITESLLNNSLVYSSPKELIAPLVSSISSSKIEGISDPTVSSMQPFIYESVERMKNFSIALLEALSALDPLGLFAFLVAILVRIIFFGYLWLSASYDGSMKIPDVVATASSGPMSINQPDQNHGRPEGGNFETFGEERGQSTYAKQC